MSEKSIKSAECAIILQKMRYLLSFVAIFVCLFFSSCNGGGDRTVVTGEIDLSGFTLLEIDPLDVRTSDNKISLFADSIVYMPLETNDSVLIGVVSKVLVSGEKLYLLDKMSESVFCFDFNDGRFLYKISAKGQGPGEYYGISDFDVTSDEEVVIQSSGQGLFFYRDGKATREIRLPIVGGEIKIGKNDTSYFYVGRSYNERIFRDFPQQRRLLRLVGDVITDEYLPYKYNEEVFSRFPSARNSFFSLKDTLVLVEYLNQETYHIFHGNLMPKYKFRFVGNRETFNYNNPIEVNKKIIEKEQRGEYSRLSRYVETDDYIFISYSIKKYVMHSFVQKKDLKINNSGLFYVDDFNNISLSAGILYVTENNELVGVIGEPDNLLQLLNHTNNISKEMQQLKTGLNGSDNPIIVKIKLK